MAKATAQTAASKYTKINASKNHVLQEREKRGERLKQERERE